MPRKSQSSSKRPVSRNGTKQQQLKGSGDYNVSDADMSRVERKLDAINSKIPDIRGGVSRIAPTLGAAAGSLFGRPDLGARLGSSVSKLVGFGDYKLASNTLLAPDNISGPLLPKFQSSSGKNSIRVTEREFVGVVTTNPTANLFNNQSFSLNPLNAQTFPWLSGLALLYDQWEPHGIVFEFVSTASDYASNTALGTVIMATDYNANDPPYATKQAMENSDFACATKLSKDLMHGVECDVNQRPTKLLYTNNDRFTTNPQFSSLGNFQIATSGCPTASAVVGELWVSYDISFYKKSVNSGTWTWNATGIATTDVYPLLNMTVRTGSTNDVVVTNTPIAGSLHPPSVISLPPYLTYFQVEVFTDQGDPISIVNANSCTPIVTRFATTATNCVHVYTFRVTGPNPRLYAQTTSSVADYSITIIPTAPTIFF